MQPDNEEIEEWRKIAERRQAILPNQFNFIQKKEVEIICGQCTHYFVRPLIVAQNDPVFVCPSCQKRNYIPIDWNVIRRVRRHY